jgi:hypothetical protein
MIETNSRRKTENLSKDLRQGSSDSTVLDIIRAALAPRKDAVVDGDAIERHKRLTNQ